MSRPSTTTSFVGAMLLVMPICMVKLLASCLGVHGPSESHATPASSQSGTGGAAPVIAAFTDEQRHAADHAASLRSTPLDDNPLLYHQAPGTDEPDRVTRYSLQMIMTFDSGSVALIDNVQYRVGDRLARSDWIVVAIDRHARVVTLRNQVTGREDRLAVEAFR